MSRSASGYGFKEYVTGFRNELKVLDAFLVQIRRLSWCHRSRHVAHERDALLFAGRSDCKIALSRQAIVYLDEINAQLHEPVDGIASFLGRVNDPGPIICLRRWALEHGAREHEPRASHFSRRDATSRVRELRSVSRHVTDSCNPVCKKKM